MFQVSGIGKNVSAFLGDVGALCKKAITLLFFYDVIDYVLWR